MTSADSASFSYSGFTAVKARKNRRNKTTRAPPPLLVQLATLREQLRQEEWFAQSSQIISSSWCDFFSSQTQSPEMLCLGLGSPSASPIARIQLAFLAETCQQLKIAHDAVTVYDPVFTNEDKALFEQLQMQILTPTPDLKVREQSTPHHTLRVPTICFMPHCDIELYDALLRANWSAAGLANLFIIGNRLQEYVDNKPLRVLESTVPCLLRAAPILENRPLPPSSTWPTAFNNTSVQFRFCLRPAEGPVIASESDDDCDRLFAGPFPWTDLISDAQGEVPPVVPVPVAQVASSAEAEAPNTEKRIGMEPRAKT